MVNALDTHDPSVISKYLIPESGTARTSDLPPRQADTSLTWRGAVATRVVVGLVSRDLLPSYGAQFRPHRAVHG